MRLFFSFLVLVLVALAPRVASACMPGGPLCTSVSPSGGSAPANLPGIPLHRVYPPLNASQTQTFELLDGAGAVVPTDVVPPMPMGEALLVPRSALAPGAYVVRITNSCGYAGSPELMQPITLGASAPLPGGPAATVQVALDRRQVYIFDPASCADPVDAAVAQLTITPSATLQPWSGVVQWVLEVDGTVWASSGFGPPVEFSPFETAKRIDQPYALCSSDANTANARALPEGSHHAVLRATVPGAATQPDPVELDFTLRCGGAAASGCAYRPAAHTTGGALLVVALLCAALALRRVVAARPQR